MRLNELLIDPV